MFFTFQGKECGVDELLFSELTLEVMRYKKPMALFQSIQTHSKTLLKLHFWLACNTSHVSKILYTKNFYNFAPLVSLEV